MNIGYVIDDRIDSTDGVQQYVKTLGNWMTGRGHKVTYIVGESNGLKTNVFGLSKTLQVRFNKNRVRVPLPVRAKRINELFATHDFDVLHVQMPYAPWLAGRVLSSAPKNVAIIGTFHVVVDSAFLTKTSPLVRPLYGTSLSRIDIPIAVSEPAAAYMRTMLNIHASVIPNAVSVSKFKNAKPGTVLNDKKTNIVFLGRLVERKGAAHLLDAYKQIANKNSRLVIVGDGPLRKRLEDQARDINGEVLFTGFVTEAEKAAYLANADIAVFPSSGGESFGIVLVEAMSPGTSVVLAGDNQGYRSVLGSIPESLVKPELTDIFAKKLKHLIEDGPARKKLIERQKRIVNQYDIAIIGPKIEAIYQKALKPEPKVP